MSDPMTRLNAALEGRYRIERQLGEGGMATVYLAADLKHERKVALKVLKPELAAVVGAERFLAEIKTTANLQHPHILPLFDSGEADSFLFYVMPYVEGESLRERLDREHQLPVDEALGIATKVAAALQAAHEQGVIHRDIKPANILLSRGEPLVSDFGIALAVSKGGAGRLTETGLSLGTPHYMSPEQATGDASVGPATDVYALGCVLYEMLVGEPPYTGSTPQAILGKIIQSKPVSATEVRRTVPMHVDAVIRRALEKVPADRFVGAADFARALADPTFRHGEAATATDAGPATGRWTRLTLVFASLSAVLAVVAGWAVLRRPGETPPEPVRRFALELPEGGTLRSGTRQAIALTPDGESLIVNVTVADQSQLYVRALADLEMVPIRGTEGVGSFFLSPDGEWIGFNDYQTETIARIPVAGGPSSTVAQTPGAAAGFLGADWGDAGYVVYATTGYRGLLRVRDVGGLPDTLTSAGVDESHSNPHVLPGGETVLFELRRGQDEQQIAALSTESRRYEILTEGRAPRFVRGGYVVFLRGNALWAAGFDPVRLALTGPPVPVAEGVRPGNFFSLAEDGTLAFVQGDGASTLGAEIVVVDLDGNRVGLPLAPRNIQSVAWSPDGRSIVFGSGGHIYTYDVVLNTAPRQITFEGGNFFPAFSPDGTRVVFSSQRTGTDRLDLFVKDLSVDAPERAILTLEDDQFVEQWPSDSLIVFETGLAGPGGNSRRDLWIVNISDPENPEARPYLTSEADLEGITVSPDGRLAAYRSEESGREVLYVRSFPVPGERTVIAQGDGLILGWSPDGQTLYWVLAQTRDTGPLYATRLQLGAVPRVLRTDTLPPVPGMSLEPRGGHLHPDGDRFVLAVVATRGDRGSAGVPRDRVILVQNFAEELKRLVPLD